MIDREREEGRVYQQVRRAEESGVAATLTLDEWINTIELFQGLCAYCRTVPFEVLDHLYPVCSGGGTTQSNCVPACFSCNARKGSKIGERFSDAMPLMEIAQKTFASLQANPDVPQYRGLYADWEDVSIERTSFPVELHRKILDLSRKEHRTFNQQVIYMLQGYITEREKREEEKGQT